MKVIAVAKAKKGVTNFSLSRVDKILKVGKWFRTSVLF